jgi:hypothetical protein
MLHPKYHFSMAAVIAAFSVSFSKIANAQMGGAYTPATSPFNFPPPDANVYRKPEHIRPDLYGPNGSDPAPRFRSPNSSPSRTYRLDRKDLFTFTNQQDPKVATGQYANFGGTFSGKYTLPFWASLGFPIKGTLNLTQTGNQVNGTLVTGNDREAEFQGAVQGSQLVGKLIFNDECAGEGSLIGDLSPTGDLMTGKYKVSDCNGKYSGRYKLKRK